jgi:roadblock/LC7 domain-containing protein
MNESNVKGSFTKWTAKRWYVPVTFWLCEAPPYEIVGAGTIGTVLLGYTPDQVSANTKAIGLQDLN